MKRLLTASQMKEADSAAIASGVHSLVLMERAALSVVLTLMHRKDADLSRVLIFCGTGNNGGDGVAAARILNDYGYEPTVILVGPREKFSESMAAQVKAAENRGIPIFPFETLIPVECPSAGSDGSPASSHTVHPMLSHATLIIDALFGIGLHREVKGVFARAVDCINRTASRRKCPVIAVDIPSGIHTDTGAVMGCAVRASVTVTFAAGKRGLFLYPGASYAGEVLVKEIGIPVPEAVPGKSHLMRTERSDLSLLPERDEAGNKGTFGKILVIAGSRTIFGASCLCAEAALRSGAGMVKVYTEENNRTPLCCRLPEALVTTYREDDWIRENSADKTAELLKKEIDWADGLIIGPGLGTSETSYRILRTALTWNSEKKLPCVLDADALNLLAIHPELFRLPAGPTILTPHVGEMSRMAGKTIPMLKEDLIGGAEAFVQNKNVVLILKDARTVIASPDGRTYLNTSGSSALSTAGSGDVLAGITGCLLTQRKQDPAMAAALSVLIHGMAGERAAERLSEAGVTAGDLLSEIPQIFSVNSP